MKNLDYFIASRRYLVLGYTFLFIGLAGNSPATLAATPSQTTLPAKNETPSENSAPVQEQPSLDEIFRRAEVGRRNRDEGVRIARQCIKATDNAPTATPFLASCARMNRKFGGLGAELNVRGMAGQEFFGVEFFPDGFDWPFFARSSVNLQNGSRLSMPQNIPERVRVVWRESDTHPINGKYGQMTYADRIIGTEVVDVGARIPPEVIDSLRRDPGTLRMKFRLSHDGVYFGWDIDRRPGYDPKKRDYHIHAVYSMEGGDFCEARIYGGKVMRKGWYIDKKTGIKVETDF